MYYPSILFQRINQQWWDINAVLNDISYTYLFTKPTNQPLLR